MVSRRGRGLALRPINSVKNIVDSVAIGVAAGVVTTVNTGIVVNDYAGAVTDIPIGAKVSSIYYFVQIQPQAAVGVVDFYFTKRPNNVVMPVPGVTGGSVNRKFIFHEEKGVPGVFNNGSPPLTFRGVIRIPKGRQRSAEADVHSVILRCSTAYDSCVKAIYKFYQ